VVRKVQATGELWGKLFGFISTREKSQARRLDLAEVEWARMQANNSAECRNCHSAAAMDFSRQKPRAAAIHQARLLTGQKTCIDCHKGIAHNLPRPPQEVEGKD
jgi:cytochrome c-type protein NapC